MSKIKRIETDDFWADSTVMDCLFANIADLNALPDVLKKRFKGTYPARKAYETKFIREGIKFQIDAVAFKE